MWKSRILKIGNWKKNAAYNYIQYSVHTHARVCAFKWAQFLRVKINSRFNPAPLNLYRLENRYFNQNTFAPTSVFFAFSILFLFLRFCLCAFCLDKWSARVMKGIHKKNKCVYSGDWKWVEQRGDRPTRYGLFRATLTKLNFGNSKIRRITNEMWLAVWIYWHVFCFVRVCVF